MAKNTPAPKKEEKPTETPTPTTPPKETPADLQELTKNVGDTLFGGKRKKAEKKEEKAPETPAQPAATPAPAVPVATPPAAAPVATPPPAKKPATQPAPKDDADLIRRTATATAEAMASRLPKPASEKDEPTTEDAEEGLTPEDRDDLTAFKKVEQLQPKMKGISDRFLKFSKARTEYEAKWLKNPENEGKEFDPNADEHAEFYKKYAEFESSDVIRLLERAKVRIEAEEVVKAELRPQIEAANRKQLIEKIQPIIANQIHGRVKGLLSKIAPDFEKILTDEKTGRLTLSEENLKRIEAEDPVVYQVLDELIGGKKDSRGQVVNPENTLGFMLAEIEQTAFAAQTGFRLNPQNPVHARILGYAQEYEKTMADAPDEVRFQTFADPTTKEKVVKQFIATSEMVRMQNEILNSRASEKSKKEKLAALDKQYWQVSIDDIEDMVIDDFSTEAQARIKRLNGAVERKIGKANPTPFSQPLPPRQDVQTAKPKPPTVLSADVIVSGAPPTTPEAKNLKENVRTKLFS